MRKLFFLVCFGSVFMLHAQNENLFNPISAISKVPQSPEVAAFEKFSGSVNMFGGTPTIGIPIYTLAGKEVSVPISLSYDASGIKVEQIATNIGLGWNLNFGGVISRNVNGHPDDYNSSAGHPEEKITEYQENLNVLLENGVIHGNTSSSVARSFYKDYVGNEVDIQPDTFSINANGLSGTIVIDYEDHFNDPDHENKAYCIDNPSLKVDIIGGENGFEIEGFKVTDTNGTVYTFNQEEYSYQWISDALGSSANPDEYGQTYATAWYLTEIKSVNNIDTFKFNYDKIEWTVDQDLDKLQQITIKQVSNNPSFHAQALKDLAYSYYRKHQVYLKDIKYNNNLVLETIRQTDRLDLEDVPRIEGLEIYDRMSTTPTIANRLLRVDFDNDSYFAGGRLKLDGVSFYRNNISDAKKYIFSYYSPEQSLPSRQSHAKDFWGYFNEGASDQPLAPNPRNNYSAYANYMDQLSDVNFSGGTFGNRTPHFIKTRIGTLESIVYPTGGKSTYNYEQHRDSQGKIVGGLRLRSVKNETLDPVTGENDELETYYYYNNLDALATVPNTPEEIPGDYNSSGIAQQHLIFEDTKKSDYGDNSADAWKETQHIVYTNNRAVASPQNITYSAVTELRFKKTGDRFNGCTVSHFYNELYEFVDRVSDKTQPYFQNNLTLGNLEYQRVYDADMKLLQETHNVYETVSFDPDTSTTFPEKVGLIVAPNGPGGRDGGPSGCQWHMYNGNGTYNYFLKFNSHPQGTCTNGFDNLDTAFLDNKSYTHYNYVYAYGYSSIWLKNISSTTKVWEGTQLQEATTSYEYLGTGHYMPTTSTTTDSKGNNSKSHTVYPSDASTLVDYPVSSATILQQMVARNQLTTPVEVTQSYKDNLLGATSYETLSVQRRFFDEFSGKIHPSKVQVAKGDVNDLENRITFKSYDSYGNITEAYYPYSGSPHTIYIWGYNGDHLLAEIKNATYSGMPSGLANGINSIIALSNTENSLTTQNDLKNMLLTFRNHPFFANAQFTTYTYDPGIGVTTVSDVRGYTMYYYYDQHNRLDYVTDEDGKVLSKNEYNLRVN